MKCLGPFCLVWSPNSSCVTVTYHVEDTAEPRNDRFDADTARMRALERLSSAFRLC
jgi:hypothetical protein